MRENSGIRDTFSVALDMARDLGRDKAGIVGYGISELRGPDGELKLVLPFANLITDVGDAYYAARGIGTSTGAGTPPTGMQIGSGVTAVSKAGAGAATVTLLNGRAFDSALTNNNLGTGLGVEIVHVCTYPAGTGTGTVQEAVITNGTIGTTSAAANTIARILTGAITKAAGDSLAITWRHKFLGA